MFGSDVGAASAVESGTGSVVSFWRRGPWARAALLLPVVVLVVVVAVLVEKPNHLYPVNADSSKWLDKVNVALVMGGVGGPIRHVAGYQLPGVGKISEIVVDRGAGGTRVSVLFLTSNGWNESGLAYLIGYPPPSDTCNVHLSGPWWQLGPLNTSTMGCAKGFHYTPGG
jgi:hypothetical protein